jgi:D-threo-aldose 1-dehydrogenase
MAIDIPRIVFGSSSLGNLYQAVPLSEKYRLLDEILLNSPDRAALDSAGKYGAGLALETLGAYLREKRIPKEKIIISNKLGWYRVPLKTPEPTFEPGIWKELRNDAEQRISYKGIIECWEQGCGFLGPEYEPDLLSIHDPDEFLAQAPNSADRRQRFGKILAALRGLKELRDKGKTSGVGVGAKDWRVIAEILKETSLDWVMIAGSWTVYRHPAEVRSFLDDCQKRGITVINSAVFHSGFLTGGTYFDYKTVDPATTEGNSLTGWRERFQILCVRYGIEPAHACVQFGMRHPAVAATALNTTKPDRVKDNSRMVREPLPEAFWLDLEKSFTRP